jgi:glucose/arabinose dehydrogenase
MVRRHFSCAVLLAGLIFVISPTAPAFAQLSGTVYVSGLSLPVGFVQDPSNASVQYVVQQGGRIRVIVNGVLQPTDFLNLPPTVVTSGGERGLLGLAFPPDYATSGRFYVYFTRNSSIGSEVGDIVVARFLRSGNPLVADPSTRFDLRWSTGNTYIEHTSQGNHNGGNMAFGPDGYLYIGTGDGGGGNDPDNNAQNPDSLLGKMLRINVNVPLSDPEGFDVPASNPFLDGVPIPARAEIWDFGLRNPWKWSFDSPGLGGTGALVIGDVGQSAVEEIDYEPAGQGARNYGWRIREGNRENIPGTPAFTPLTEPIWVFGRSDAASITGGYVYRGSRLGASFRGRYLFGDFVTSRVWSFALTLDGSGNATPFDLREHTAELGGAGAFGGISAFGQDASGELYIVCYGLGRIIRVDAAAPVSDARMALDAPAPNATIGRSFRVAGWALDLNATTGAGVDAVHVYAYPLPSGAPAFLGVAALGDARPDVAAVFGPAFQNSGFHLDVTGVAPGRYRIVAFARSTVTGTFVISRSADVTVQTTARMAIDGPSPGAVVQPIVLAGWAIDLAASAGTGVDAIHVYAYPNPGSGTPPLFVGFAQYGLSRPDVGQAFGPQFTNSGYSLTIDGLAFGTYQLVAFAHSTVTGLFEVRAVTVTIGTGERMAVDGPPPGATVGQSFTVAGWALDLSAATGTGVNAVHVWAFSSGGTATFLGVATYGTSRPDVAAVFGARFQNTGYTLNTGNTGLAPGAYTLVVFARSTVTGTFSNAIARPITVTAP